MKLYLLAKDTSFLEKGYREMEVIIIGVGFGLAALTDTNRNNILWKTPVRAL